jgi:hypothetical protein
MGVQSLRRDALLPASPFIRSPAWDPTYLGASLKAYWDAYRYDLMTDDGGGLISSWRDIVGAYDATASGSARPTYSATGFNGSPVVNGDGAANVMTLAPVPVGIPTGATACEEWFLIDQKSLVGDTTTRVYGEIGTGTGATSRRTRRTVAAGVNRTSVVDAGTTISNATVDFSGRHVVRVVVTGTTVDIEVDGVSGGGGASVSATGTSRLRFFANAAGTAANFALVGIAARAITLPLTAGQAAQMYSFLNRRR